MAEIHYGFLAVLEHCTGIFHFLKVIRSSRIMIKPDSVFLFPAVSADDLIEIIVYIVYYYGRSSREVLMRPCVCNDVHGNSGSLKSLPLCKPDRFSCKLPVWAAYKAVFPSVSARAAPFGISVQITGKKVKRGPYPCNILNAGQICPGVCHFLLKLCGGG